MKKILLSSLLISFVIWGAGCTNGEISDGSNGVGIGIGVGPRPTPWPPYETWPPGPNDPGYGDGHDNPGYPDWPNDPNDPYDPPQRPPHKEPVRPPGKNCDRLGCWDPNFVASVSSVEANAASGADKLVAKYGIPASAAKIIARSFNNAHLEGLDAYYEMGLTQSDFKAMMNRKLPSDETVKRASVKLGLSEKQSRDLLTAMMRNFFAQATNVNSPYWKYCQMGGHWKTDQNRSCAKLSWPGCSPENGAKFCY
jgi:hypothetical protein